MKDENRPWHDRHWHAAVLAGDDAAWQAGYDAVFESVQRYIRWRSGGIADLADDVLQETWLTAVRRIADFDSDRGSFATWVCGIAANVMRNALRSRHRRLSRVEAMVHDHASPPPNDNDRSELTALALAELPEHYERVLRDKYVRGDSVAAMAAERGDSTKAVESMLTRARAAFREIFQQLSAAHG